MNPSAAPLTSNYQRDTVRSSFSTATRFIASHAAVAHKLIRFPRILHSYFASSSSMSLFSLSGLSRCRLVFCNRKHSHGAMVLLHAGSPKKNRNGGRG